MALSPYLFFEGRCEEALDFYRVALGAEVTMLLRYKDSPVPPAPGTLPADAGAKIMHASLKIGADTLLASDGFCKGASPVFEGFSLSLTVTDAEEARRRFDALAAGGQIGMPLAPTFFSPLFGMVRDRFGVSWMIYVAP